MRIPETCSACGGRSLTYATVTGAVIRTRYKKCDQCGRTAKTIAVIRQKTFLSGSEFQHANPSPKTMSESNSTFNERN
jgi:hypothetical protein